MLKTYFMKGLRKWIDSKNYFLPTFKAIIGRILCFMHHFFLSVIELFAYSYWLRFSCWNRADDSTRLIWGSVESGSLHFYALSYQESCGIRQWTTNWCIYPIMISSLWCKPLFGPWSINNPPHSPLFLIFRFFFQF